MIQGKPIWGASIWKEIANSHMPIRVIRLCTHTHSKHQKHIVTLQTHLNYMYEPPPGVPKATLDTTIPQCHTH